MENGLLGGGGYLIYFFMCPVAGIIASAGLIVDRVEIVIGLMLISPLLSSLILVLRIAQIIVGAKLVLFLSLCLEYYGLYYFRFYLH